MSSKRSSFVRLCGGFVLVGAVLAAACSDEATPGSDAALDTAVVDAGADAAVSGCAGATELPATIDSDLAVGPGCVRLNRTNVQNNAVLTIAAGTTVLVEDGGFIDVSHLSDGAALVAVGTASQPILFTSAAASPAPGDWQCVRIGDNGSRSELEYVTLEYGGQPCNATGALPEAALVIDAAMRAVENVTVQDSSTHGVLIGRLGGVRAFSNNTFARNSQASIKVSMRQVLAVGAPNTFVDTDDMIDVDGTFALETTGTWRAQDVPYRLSSPEIRGGAVVTIEAGTVLAMAGQSFDVFLAEMHVEGTAANPVTFTSAQNPPQAGDWGCILIDAPSGTVSIDHAIIEYAGNGEGCTGANRRAAVHTPVATRIENTTIRNSDSNGILTNGTCDTSWCGNTFESIADDNIVCENYSTPYTCL